VPRDLWFGGLEDKYLIEEKEGGGRERKLSSKTGKQMDTLKTTQRPYFHLEKGKKGGEWRGELFGRRI